MHKKDKIMMNKNKLEGTEREVQKKRKIRMIEKKLDHAIRRSEKNAFLLGERGGGKRTIARRQ